MFEVIVLLAILAIRFGPRLEGLSYQWLDDFMVRCEARLGRFGWSAVLGVILVAIACLLVRPQLSCGHLGGQLANLAMDPFHPNPENQVPHRILTPLISYLLGLRGCTITLTNLLISVAFIGVVYNYFRERTSHPGDALLAACSIGFSLAVTTGIHCGGYSDVLTYLLVFLMWQYRQHRLLFYVLFLAALFNRESVLFLAPWLAFISMEGSDKKSRRCLELFVGMGIAIALYGWFYLSIQAERSFEYSLSYYFEPIVTDPISWFRETIPLQGLGLFSVFKILWVIPCLAMALAWKNRSLSNLAGMLLCLFCAWSQMFLAFDTSRMFTMGFMIMILALDDLLVDDHLQIRRWVFGLVLINLLIPQVYTAAKIVEVWQSLAMHVLDI